MPNPISLRPDGPEADLTPGPADASWGADGGWTEVARNGRLSRSGRRTLLAIPAGLLTAGWVALLPCVMSADAAGTQAVALTIFTACALVFTYCVGLNAGHAHGSESGVRRYANRLAEVLQIHRERRPSINLPRAPKGEGHVYVIEFTTGTVKVGLTEDPKSRLAQHRSKAAAYGVHIANYWISPAHINFRDNETRLINQCVKVSRRSRNEYFHEVGYARARQFACDLSYFSAVHGATGTEGGWVA